MFRNDAKETKAVCYVSPLGRPRQNVSVLYSGAGSHHTFKVEALAPLVGNNGVHENMGFKFC